jgi:HrpA-like RNA helicase
MEYKKEIIQKLIEESFLIVTGETGSGKST